MMNPYKFIAAILLGVSAIVIVGFFGWLLIWLAKAILFTATAVIILGVIMLLAGMLAAVIMSPFILFYWWLTDD